MLSLHDGDGNQYQFPMKDLECSRIAANATGSYAIDMHNEIQLVSASIIRRSCASRPVQVGRVVRYVAAPSSPKQVSAVTPVDSRTL